MNNRTNMKQLAKAQKIVQGAVGTFSKAIAEVEKANEMIAQAIEHDKNEMEKLSEEIQIAYKRLDALQAEKLNKENEIIQNKELISRLNKFTK